LDGGAGFDEEPSERTGGFCLELDCGLLGLDIGQSLAVADVCADFDQPGFDDGVSGIRDDGGEGDKLCHGVVPCSQLRPRPSATRSKPRVTSVGPAFAADSRTFEMDGLASRPVTRWTGWSR